MFSTGSVRTKLRLGLYFLLSATLMWPQQLSSAYRGLAQEMLQKVGQEIREKYYDRNLHGVNWDAAISLASKQIDQAPSMDMALSYIAAAVDTLNDSHTVFYPPARTRAYDFGLRYQMIGDDRCFVTHVQPGSDAEAKGILPGDEVITINGFLPSRKSLTKMEYVIGVLRPQTSIRIREQPVAGGLSREITIDAKVTLLKRPSEMAYSSARAIEDSKHFYWVRTAELGNDVMVLKLPVFRYDDAETDAMIAKARKHRALILDLRGNPGGASTSLYSLVGSLFNHDLKLGDRVMRKGSEPIMVKARHHHFDGQLIILVDSESASASELLARLVQIEKRGIVLGDRTAGRVMEAIGYYHAFGGSSSPYYVVAVTDADLIMTDGKSLEHIGVTPDETVIPSAKALANELDPALARAAALAGASVTPDAAGKLLPFEWPPQPQ